MITRLFKNNLMEMFWIQMYVEFNKITEYEVKQSEAKLSNPIVPVLFLLLCTNITEDAGGEFLSSVSLAF